MIDTNKYEGLIDAEGYIDYDGLDHLLAEAKRLSEWKKLVSDIVRQQDGSHLREMLKEMIE